MAFPSTPTNGQIAVVGGIAYQYATTPNSWSRILSSANVITANAISVNSLTANLLNVNNNLNITGNISATGNVTGNYILGNGSLLTGIATGSSSNISNGNSNISLASSGGNATVNITGTSNVAVFATTGEYVTGVVSATGNVTGGNILTGGLISATGTLSVTGVTTLAAVGTGNLAAGNITTGGLISAGGNITGGNINTTNLSVSGNVLGNLLPSANVTYNLGSPTQRWNTIYLAGNTIELGPQSISATATGVSMGTGNVAGGNVTTGGLISATGNITANNGMFTNIVNVASHTGAVVSVTGNVTGGNVSASSGNATVASGSVSFNGTTQYLSVPANAVFQLTGDFTIESWVYMTTINSHNMVFGNENLSTGTDYCSIRATTIELSIGAANPAWTFTPVVNTWYHTAVVRSGGTLSVFVNGTALTLSAGSATNSSQYLQSGCALYIGRYGGGAGLPFTGYMSNFRVVKGVAVYTSAFTPSTNPLTSTQNANVNGTPTAAITGTSTSLLLNTVNGASFLADSSSYNFTVTNVNTATSNAASPTWASPAGSVTATYGIFTTSVNTASFTGAVVSVTGNVTANNGMFTTIVNTASYTGAVVSVTGNVTANNGIFTTSINTASFTGTTISVTGNVTANNGMFTNIVNVASHTGAVVSVTGNVTANNGMFTTIVNTASHTGAVVSVSGNVTANNGMFTTIVNVASHTGAVVSVSGNVTGGNISTAGNLTLSGTGQRILADFSSVPVANRAMFQTSTANGATNIYIIPSGTAVNTSFTAVNNSDPTTASIIQIAATSTDMRVASDRTGAGTYLPLTMLTSGSERFRIDTNGNVGIGNTAPTSNLSVAGTAYVSGNITGSYFIGNGSQLTGIAGGGTPNSVVNGTSNVVVASSGNVTVGVAGTPNVAVFATTGGYVTGLISATGNMVANNGMFTNIVNVASHTGAVVSVTGNVTANNGMFTNIVNVASHTGAVVSVTGNITGGNIIGTLLTAAQTNITSVGTLSTLSVSGNVTGANVNTATTIVSGSVLFNGTTQYLTLPSSSTPLALTTGDFTVECWFKTNDIAQASAQTLIWLNGNTSAYSAVRLGLDTSGLAFYVSTDGTTWAINSGVIGTVASNTWYHAAVTRSTNTFKVFLNGTQVGPSYTQSGSLYAGTLNYIGSLNYTAVSGTPFRQMNGYISNMRVVKGVAVYTANFTPSTTPLTSTQSANINGNPSAAITGNSTGLLMNTVVGAGFLTDSSSYALTVTNVAAATSDSASPTWSGTASGSVTSTYGIFATSVNTASFTGAVVSVTGNITGGNVTTAGVLTVNSGAAATAIVNGASNAVGNIGSSTTYFNRLFAQATTALYADLAEVYKADAEYPPGTVLVFGGSQEVTISTQSHDARIAGVVSTNPAHVMNSGLVSEYTVDVGLIGRVPCQVIGPVAAGDRVVSSNRAGVAERLDMQHYQPGVIIGKAVESHNGTGVGTIEVVVGRL